jgi:hypothetical protein
VALWSQQYYSQQQKEARLSSAKRSSDYKEVGLYFEQLDVELQSGQLVPSAKSDLPFITVEGLSYHIDPSSLELKPDAAFLDVNTFGYMPPYSEGGLTCPKLQ